VRLLVDANLSPNVAAQLRTACFDASHVADHALASATDEAIAAFAAEHDYAILSADSDFATLLAMNGNRAPSLLLLRSADALTPTEQADLLAANLPAIEDELRAGAVV
jgi:predicted nuclease of predicted toxin-antitoxin system